MSLTRLLNTIEVCFHKLFNNITGPKSNKISSENKFKQRKYKIDVAMTGIFKTNTSGSGKFSKKSKYAGMMKLV